MPPGIENRGNMPVSAISIENIKFGLMDSKIDATFIKQNLNNLIKDVQSVNGNVIQLGITADQLKDVYGNIVKRNGQLGKDFPADQLQILDELIDQVEAKEAEQKGQGTNDNAEIGYTTETITSNEKATERMARQTSNTTNTHSSLIIYS